MRFPARSPSPALKAAIRAVCLVILACLPHFAETPFKANGNLATLQILAPWDGPGAAIFNPAFLSETSRFHAGAGRFQSVTGKAGIALLQVAAAIPGGLVLGASWFDNKTLIDGSNAVYLEYQATPSIAWGMGDPAAAGFHLGFGAAVPIRGMNAFNAVTSTNTGLDIGTNLIFPKMGDRFGRIHLAVAAQNLMGGFVKLPEDNPSLIQSEYEAYKLAFEVSALWSGMAGMLDLSLDQKLQTGAGGGKEGPGYGNFGDGSLDLLTAYGFEFRPIRYFGVKLERTWLEYWTAGARGFIPIGGFDLGLEFALTHDKLSKRDEGRGLLWALGLNLSN